MIVGFSRHGRSDNGAGAVNYLVDGMTTAIGYMTAKTRRGAARTPPPVIVRGDHRLTRELINRVPFTRRYVSGVLSFSEKAIGPDVEVKIMDRFEATAFAGIPKDRYNILWVRHTHAGRHELHFLVPAIDLGSGKGLNINPPRRSTREMFDSLRRLTNDEFRLSDPDEPARARMIRVPSYLAKGKPTRDGLRSSIGSFFEARLQAGLIKTRDDVLILLRDSGYTVTRVGEKYVTIVDQAGKRCRLKGALFEREFAPQVQASAKTQLSQNERAELEGKLARLVASRAAFNEKRYHVPAIEAEQLHSLPELPEEMNKTQPYDRIGAPFVERLGALDQGISRARGARGAALERTHGAVHRWHSACVELERAGCLTHDARERIDRATERAKTRHREREADRDLISKYGALVTTPSRSRERGVEREMEMEREFA